MVNKLWKVRPVYFRNVKRRCADVSEKCIRLDIDGIRSGNAGRKSFEERKLDKT